MSRTYFNFCFDFLNFSPETFDDRGKAVKATWLPRCDKANLFYSNDSWSFLAGAIPLNVPEGISLFWIFLGKRELFTLTYDNTAGYPSRRKFCFS